ncbi:LysR substrate-binding domain-containing protein [Crenobacter sp. SG2305]|uniref:LysR family transcriptional regulator n=1 Tax=Crenobacter oryzisoli TaxID=3056844 RepID=UPI0025AACD58|nr:LysR family transcriptional regulator [Crenobacter sp. SG2305]MDN0082948.1 LysR substrate-binding domain-containing protein [Crenobacter sp. SG2305]
MELRHLRYFIAVAEELNFTRAAEKLHIGQPPLSQQIQALEAELGVMLFNRTRRRVELTSAGERFLPRAIAILQDTASAAEDARRAALGEVGELSIGFTPSLPFTSFLPRLIHRYRQRYPDVTLALREMMTQNQLAAIASSELDIGIVRLPDVDVPQEVALRQLLVDPLVVVTRDDHPLAAQSTVSLAQLRDEPFVMYPAAAGTGLYRHLMHLCDELGFRPQVVQEAREGTTLIGLVAAGLGVSILPGPLSCIQVEGVCYRPLSDAGAVSIASLATRVNDTSPLVAHFIELLGEMDASRSTTPPS